MATTAAPYGFKPVNLIGGTPYAGSTRQIKIASGYASNLYNGQIVRIATDGTIALMVNVGSAADVFLAGTVGVFVGCTYTDPTLKYKLNSQYWPTGTVASDAMAYVVDDPNAVFQVQSAGSLVQADLGANVPLNAAQSTSTGSTTTGNSNTAISATTAATTLISLRIVDFVNGPFSTVGDAYTDVLVKFNPVAHSYNNPLGVA
jgi:uncharacterized membrane protein